MWRDNPPFNLNGILIVLNIVCSRATQLTKKQKNHGTFSIEHRDKISINSSIKQLSKKFIYCQLSFQVT